MRDPPSRKTGKAPAGDPLVKRRTVKLMMMTLCF